MKFLLFIGRSYYPQGGAEDLQGAFGTLEAAKAAVPKGEWDGWKEDYWWAHIAEITDDGLTIRWESE